MYRVKFNKLAIMPDGSTGNISQGADICYTDSPCGALENTINSHLKKQVCVIEEVVNVRGLQARLGVLVRMAMFAVESMR